jgi:electron-transferring-flavoprotein dehydrogenase
MEREVLEFDVQFIGAGPAGLAGAIHLANLIARTTAVARRARQPLGEITIAVLEKSATVGAHGHLGLVMDRARLRELMPDFRAQAARSQRGHERRRLLFVGRRAASAAVVPPMLQNHGNLCSRSALVAWMAQKGRGEGRAGRDRDAGRPRHWSTAVA